MPQLHPLAFLLLALLVVAGPVWHAGLPRHRAIVEERIKERRLTMAQAQRRLQLMRAGADAATLLGAAILVLLVGVLLP